MHLLELEVLHALHPDSGAHRHRLHNSMPVVEDDVVSSSWSSAAHSPPASFHPTHSRTASPHAHADNSRCFPHTQAVAADSYLGSVHCTLAVLGPHGRPAEDTGYHTLTAGWGTTLG